MAYLDTTTVSGATLWNVPITVNGSRITRTLRTQGKYVDKDIYIELTTPTATIVGGQAYTTLTINDATTGSGFNVSDIITSQANYDSTPGEGVYYLSFIATGSGYSTVTGAGWASAGSCPAPTAATKTQYYPLRRAAFGVSGNVIYCTTAGYVPQGSANSGIGTVSLGTYRNNLTTVSSSDIIQVDQGKYLEIGAGYYANAIYFQSQPLTENYHYDTFSHNPTDVALYATVTVEEGTASSNSNADVVNVSTVGTNATNVSSIVSLGTVTEPSSGYYLAFTGSGNSSITHAGWMAQSSSLPTSSKTKYFALQQVGFYNTVDVAVESNYTDISAIAPVLISGGYLYVSEGYTPNIKISLAKLIPDEASDKLSPPRDIASYMIQNTYAYNSDGEKIAGTIPIRSASDISVDGDTVTFNWGYYPSSASTTATVASGTITLNIAEADLPNGATPESTLLNRGQYIKIGRGWYDSDIYYQAQANSGNITLVAQSGTSVDGYATASVRSAEYGAGATSASINRETDTNNIAYGADATVIDRNTTKPSSGYYISVEIQGYSAITQSGWIDSGNLNGTGKIATATEYISLPTGAAAVTQKTDYSGADPTLTWDLDNLQFTASYATGNLSVAGRITTTGWVVSGTSATSANVAAAGTKTFALTDYIDIYDGTYD